MASIVVATIVIATVVVTIIVVTVVINSGSTAVVVATVVMAAIVPSLFGALATYLIMGQRTYFSGLGSE